MKIVGLRGKPIYSKERPGDIRRSVADVSRLHNVLGYRPSTSLSDGLRKTLDFFRRGES